MCGPYGGRDQFFKNDVGLFNLVASWLLDREVKPSRYLRDARVRVERIVEGEEGRRRVSGERGGFVVMAKERRSLEGCRSGGGKKGFEVCPISLRCVDRSVLHMI